MDHCPRCTAMPVTRPRLSPQETTVLQALAWYGSNAEVSASMYLSPATVSTLLGRIRKKYAQANRAVPNQILLIRAALQDHVICLHHLLGHHREHAPPPAAEPPSPDDGARNGPRHSACCALRLSPSRHRLAAPPHAHMPHCQR